MDFLTRALLVVGAFGALTGCQFGYLLHSAKGQLSLLSSRVALETALQDPSISEKEKQKMQLTLEARKFAIETVGLKQNSNYSEYVKLPRPYVTYVLSAAEKMQLKQLNWDYPFVGKMPYKGFFDEQLAKDEEQEMLKKGYDTYLRGVSAYSTLGWFRDPLLSSMTNYRDDILVNTIIHETVHVTLYIKNSADFNERLAVFIANKATEQFYREREGPDSPTLQKIKDENEDENRFSVFISQELNDLETWYKQATPTEVEKQQRLQEIQRRFEDKVAPKMKTKSFGYFKNIQLNNARLLVYKTYVADLSDFAKLFLKVGQDYRRFLQECQKLEKVQNPELELKKLAL